VCVEERGYGHRWIAGLAEHQHEIIDRWCQSQRVSFARCEEQRVQLHPLGNSLRILGNDHLTVVVETTSAEEVDHRASEVAPSRLAVLHLVRQQLLNVNTRDTARLEHPFQLLDKKA